MDPWINEVINMPVGELTLSEEFKATLRTQGFNTLNEFMSLPLKDILLSGWLTKPMVEELATFMFTSRRDHTS